jgi:hypothetical protein
MRNKPGILLASFVIFIQAVSAQNIFVLNNTPGAATNYHTLQGALDSVPSGSIILMQGSGQSYGYANVTKPVVIYGAGYFLGQNIVPNTQANSTEAMVEGISFSAGSQGSIISGLNFSTSALNNGNGIRIAFNSTTNITVSRCRLEMIGCNSQGCRPHGLVIQNSTNITLSQCYIILGGYLMFLNNATGLLFKNNIVLGNPTLNLLSDFSAGTYNYTFQNNSFNGSIVGTNFLNGNFINNVIIHTTGAPTVAGAMTFADHNVSNINIYPGGGTNIANADGPNTYVLFSNPAISSNDEIWKLKPGSVAIGYGNDGTDAGGYGGAIPYVLSGIPAIPNIYFANTPQVGTTTGGLKIHLKIKANN